MKNNIILNDAAEVLKKVDFNFLEGKTVLITGATGLLGTHFLATLALLKDRGMKIKVVGACHSAPADYTKELANRDEFFLVEDGLNFNTDVVIHAAGYAQPAVFTSRPAETIRINTELTQRLLNQVVPGGKFLFVSSSEVYSGLQSIATEEDIGTSTPYHNRACYIEGKRCGEAIVNAYRKVGIDAKSARLGITYGPGTRKNDQRAMSIFIRGALADNLVNMRYSGKETRTFGYVSDAVETIWNIVLHGKQSVYNVDGISYNSIAFVAEEIASITGAEFRVPLSHGEMPGSGDVRMSTKRVREEFDKYSFTGIKEGLKKTVEWNRRFYEPV